MEKIWIETPNGYFFPQNNKLPPAIPAKLQMLSLDGVAENKGYGFFITFEKSVILSDEDAELLKFPPKNPYRLSIRTLGILGKSDFRYILEVMRPNGQFFINPKFNGAILHIDSNTTYRLNADQYELVRLTQDSNENISKLNNRQKAMTQSLTNAYKIQQHAALTDAQLDNFLDAENLKIVVPDCLDIEFEEIYNGKFQVQPLLLAKGNDGNFYKLFPEDFKETFKRRRDVPDVYVGRDRRRYICSEKIKSGLTQIKFVPKMDRADKERYSKQPKELFTEDIFYFDNAVEVDDEKNIWLPNEGELSDRVIGIEEFTTDVSFEPNAFKIDWLKTEAEFEDNFETEETPENFPETDFGDEVEKRNKIYAIKIKPNFERIDYSRNNFRRIESEFETALLPNVKLLPHQIIGVKKIFNLWQSGATGILIADDMGLGKTLQTLAFIAGLKKSCVDYPKINNPILIVAPTALLTNWKAEYEKFIQKNIFKYVIELHGNNLKKFFTEELTPNSKRKLKLSLPKDTLALTTYETLRDYQFSFAEVDWCCIIADEVQKIKNPTTGITTAIKAMKYDFSISLSGTPVENSWIDLWSIMDFVQPAWLGDLRNFKETYLQPLKNDSSPANIETVGKKFKNSLGDLFIRRMKDDHLTGLPKKFIFPCPEEMPEYQKSCYLAVLKSIQLAICINPLPVIADLRNISLHPDLATKSLNSFFDMQADEVIARSARLKKTFELLEEIKNRNEKVIIFVVSRKMQLILIHLVEQKFRLKLLPPINGSMNGTDRQKFIDEFNHSANFNILVLSPEAAGVGFTITSANNVIHLSRTWNPAKEEQATDRVYRIGQNKNVNVYLPMACHKDFGVGGSFDEKLNALLNYKKCLSENVLFPTGESSKDGIAIFNELTQTIETDSSEYYWNINLIDGVTEKAFEKIVIDLYIAVGYAAKKTDCNNDNGADIVAISENGFLIKCVHKENIFEKLGSQPIQEIYSAKVAYESEYKEIKFQPVVITNAENFSESAIEYAANNNVKIIARNELDKMLTQYKILKF